jgi:hypothetical protein
MGSSLEELHHFGLSWHNTRNKWHARIKINGKHVSLGLYDIEEDAAIAYDCAAIGYFGDYALLNILFKD